jgi:spore maturation protein CgeB
VRRLGHIYTRDHNAFNSSAKMVLNVARNSMSESGFSPATRIFEAAGAASCIITDAWRGVEEFLEPAQEILVAHSGEEVRELVESHTPERAKQVGENARRRVLAHHTYAHRAQQIDLLLTGSPSTWELGTSLRSAPLHPQEASQR